MESSNTRVVRIDIFLRAVAILLVALNHADDAVARNNWLNGGMSVLMMVSGMSFARLALAGGTPERAVRTLTRFAAKLFTATIAVVLLTTPVRETSLFDASGLIYTFTELPFWYGVQMACICVVLAGLFAIGPIGRGFFRAPALASLGLLAALLVMHTVSDSIWDTAVLEHRLPHLIAWNFVLGWTLYFLTLKTRPQLVVAALAVAVTSALIGWGWKSDAGYLMLGCLAAIGFTSVRLPAGAAHVTNLIAQATFFIYLTSWIFTVGIAHTLHRLVPVLSTTGALATIAVAWTGSVAASVALWVTWTATARALHTVRRQPEARTALAPASS